MNSISNSQQPEEINTQNILIRLSDFIKFRLQLCPFEPTSVKLTFNSPKCPNMLRLLSHFYILQVTTLKSHPVELPKK